MTDENPRAPPVAVSLDCFFALRRSYFIGFLRGINSMSLKVKLVWTMKFVLEHDFLRLSIPVCSCAERKWEGSPAFGTRAYPESLIKWSMALSITRRPVYNDRARYNQDECSRATSLLRGITLSFHTSPVSKRKRLFYCTEKLIRMRTCVRFWTTASALEGWANRLVLNDIICLRLLLPLWIYLNRGSTRNLQSLNCATPDKLTEICELRNHSISFKWP